MNHGPKALKRGASLKKSSAVCSRCLARGVLKGKMGSVLLAAGRRMTRSLWRCDWTANHRLSGHSRWTQEATAFRIWGEPKTPVGLVKKKKKKSEITIFFSQEITIVSKPFKIEDTLNDLTLDG